MKKSIPSGVSSINPEVQSSEPLRLLTETELLAVAVLWKRSKREVVTRFGGGSMRPSIPELAPVRLRFGDEDAAVGDVIAFQIGDRLIVHRVVAKRGAKLFTRGDAELLPDPFLVDRQAVLGKVILVESSEGWIELPASRRRSSRAIVFACVALSRILGAGVAVRCIAVARIASRIVHNLLRGKNEKSG
jgi:hypothetical protein